MRVLKKEPGRAPEVVEIDGSLESMQDLVGGLIQHIELGHLDLICDEEGKLKGKEPNIYIDKIKDVIVGTVFFAGHDEEDFTDISEHDIELLMAILPIASVKLG